MPSRGDHRGPAINPVIDGGRYAAFGETEPRSASAEAPDERQAGLQLDRQWFYDGLSDDSLYEIADGIYENVLAALGMQPVAIETEVLEGVAELRAAVKRWSAARTEWMDAPSERSRKALVKAGDTLALLSTKEPDHD